MESQKYFPEFSLEDISRPAAGVAAPKKEHIEQILSQSKSALPRKWSNSAFNVNQTLNYMMWLNDQGKKGPFRITESNKSIAMKPFVSKGGKIRKKARAEQSKALLARAEQASDLRLEASYHGSSSEDEQRCDSVIGKAYPLMSYPATQHDVNLQVGSRLQLQTNLVSFSSKVSLTEKREVNQSSKISLKNSHGVFKGLPSQAQLFEVAPAPLMGLDGNGVNGIRYIVPKTINEELQHKVEEMKRFNDNEQTLYQIAGSLHTEVGKDMQGATLPIVSANQRSSAERNDLAQRLNKGTSHADLDSTKNSDYRLPEKGSKGKLESNPALPKPHNTSEIALKLEESGSKDHIPLQVMKDDSKDMTEDGAFYQRGLDKKSNDYDEKNSNYSNREFHMVDRINSSRSQESQALTKKDKSKKQIRFERNSGSHFQSRDAELSNPHTKRMSPRITAYNNTEMSQESSYVPQAQLGKKIKQELNKSNVTFLNQNLSVQPQNITLEDIKITKPKDHRKEKKQEQYSLFLQQKVGSSKARAGKKTPVKKAKQFSLPAIHDPEGTLNESVMQHKSEMDGGLEEMDSIKPQFLASGYSPGGRHGNARIGIGMPSPISPIPTSMTGKVSIRTVSVKSKPQLPGHTALQENQGDFLLRSYNESEKTLLAKNSKKHLSKKNLESSFTKKGSLRDDSKNVTWEFGGDSMRIPPNTLIKNSSFNKHIDQSAFHKKNHSFSFPTSMTFEAVLDKIENIEAGATKIPKRPNPMAIAQMMRSPQYTELTHNLTSQNLDIAQLLGQQNLPTVAEETQTGDYHLLSNSKSGMPPSFQPSLKNLTADEGQNQMTNLAIRQRMSDMKHEERKESTHSQLSLLPSGLQPTLALQESSERLIHQALQDHQVRELNAQRSNSSFQPKDTARKLSVSIPKQFENSKRASPTETRNGSDYSGNRQHRNQPLKVYQVQPKDQLLAPSESIKPIVQHTLSPASTNPAMKQAFPKFKEFNQTSGLTKKPERKVYNLSFIMEKESEEVNDSYLVSNRNSTVVTPTRSTVEKIGSQLTQNDKVISDYYETRHRNLGQPTITSHQHKIMQRILSPLGPQSPTSSKINIIQVNQKQQNRVTIEEPSEAADREILQTEQVSKLHPLSLQKLYSQLNVETKKPRWKRGHMTSKMSYLRILLNQQEPAKFYQSPLTQVRKKSSLEYKRQSRNVSAFQQATAVTENVHLPSLPLPQEKAAEQASKFMDKYFAKDISEQFLHKTERKSKQTTMVPPKGILQRKES